MHTTVIDNVTLVNEGRQERVSLEIADGRIRRIRPVATAVAPSGLYLLPGVIDEHVHLRDPGLTHKADIEHETRAAVAGGVTTVMDMPNVVPQTTTNELLRQRLAAARPRSLVNYYCYLGATNDNIDELRRLDSRDAPAVKLFMGASTGNMLVDREDALRRIFAEVKVPIVTHCEDTARINARLREAQQLWGDDPSVEHHPWVRDAECCLRSTELALRLARETGARLHVAHVTTKQEIELLSQGGATFELCLPHLLFSDADYARLGTRIKCNPAVKTAEDRDALRHALRTAPFLTVATDHAPHLPEEKAGGCRRAASGIPMVQFSLVSMLGLVDEGVLSMERLVEVMCHNPARLFALPDRGFVREGHWADLTLVRRRDWTVTRECVLSKCGWSPLEGRTMHWQVVATWVNGQQVYAAD